MANGEDDYTRGDYQVYRDKWNRLFGDDDMFYATLHIEYGDGRSIDTEYCLTYMFEDAFLLFGLSIPEEMVFLPLAEHAKAESYPAVVEVQSMLFSRQEELPFSYPPEEDEDE